ncbi:protein ELFN1 [Tachyglossus aculeatus]|uniref:protein ELFN1 n=1 Tax=Tachyglossus aculeatus TaxID=9261 RepID=UPI0018F2F48B|nr:protein ELFN1 [Tachyglossus aculeatus]
MAAGVGRRRQRGNGAAAAVLCACVAAMSLLHAGGLARADCWLIEGDKGFVWLAICSQNQPPYESIPQQINSTIVDLRLNDNKIKSVQYSSLSRFGNLTYLNLTKNEISSVEDGAFSAQFNLQVLQLGYNRLRNLSEGLLRGLGKLEYLYLQANLIETVTPNAFWECPNVMNVDLSMNRIQRLDGGTFAGLSRLSVCELYSNPFYCSCELLAFLRWLADFANATRAYDRVQCESPPDYAGYFLLGQGRGGYRNALGTLAALCADGARPAAGPRRLPPARPPPPTAAAPLEDGHACPEDDCFSGDGPTLPTSPRPPAPGPEARPHIRVKHLTHNSATLTVQLPHPFGKMYVLAQFENGFSSDITKLRKEREDIELANLVAHTNYTYCVVSLGQPLRYNHTCLTICPSRPPPPPPPSPGPALGSATATHYIVTVLGCLLGMVLVLGLVYHCLRRRRRRQEQHKKAAAATAAASAGSLKKTIIELKYGPELEAPGGPFLPPAAGEAEPYKLGEAGGTPRTKGNYMEVRTGDQRDREPGLGPDAQGSVAEISTIAKEVDKVNQIINNCIDALKSEATSFQGVKSGAVCAVEPQLVLLSEQPSSQRGAFLAPAYQDSYAHPLQRHHGPEGPSTRASTSSSGGGGGGGSIRSPRPFRPEASTHKYADKVAAAAAASGPADAILTVTPAAAVLRAEAERIRQFGEHRHSYPGSHPGEPPPPTPPPPHDSLGARKPSILEPLTRPRPRDLAYSPLSPQYRHLSYSSSPEYACRPSHSIWERFRLNRRRHKDDDEFVAAGHALRKKVQFAKDEDLHDILDYWKGVSAQHKS